MNESHPIRLVAADDLSRSRLTVFFRWLLAIPHFIVVLLWGIPVLFAVLIGWFVALFTGRLSEGLHDFIARFNRYATHVFAYANLLADPFPAFGSEEGYPVDLQVAPAAPQNRLVTLFRIILAIPAYIFLYILNYVWGIAVFLAWLICLIAGRMPDFLQKFGLYVLRFQMQTTAYYSLLTDRYPSFSSEPPTAQPAEAIEPPSPAPTG